MSFAVLCSGQGAQEPAMFDILESDAAAQTVFDDASAAAGIDLVSIKRDPALAFANEVAQPLICAYQFALWSALAPRIARPILFAGYSVGELAAYGCAGSLAITDLLALARERADAMNAASASDDGMLALRGLARSVVEALCLAHGASIAIVNGDDHFIVGGSSSAFDALMRNAIEKGGSAQRLRVGVASHTPRLASASERFGIALRQVPWSDPRTPVLSGLDGSAVRDALTAIDVLARQISTTIRWVDCMDSAHERGMRTCLELGPGNALARMVRERYADVEARSVADFRSMDAAVDWVERATG